MQNGMIPAQPTPHDRLCFVPTSKVLIPPSKSGKTHHRLARLADSLAARFADSGGGGGWHKGSGGGGVAVECRNISWVYKGRDTLQL